MLGRLVMMRDIVSSKEKHTASTFRAWERENSLFLEFFLSARDIFTITTAMVMDRD